MSVSAHRKLFNSEIPPTSYGVVRIWVVLVVLFFSFLSREKIYGQDPNYTFDAPNSKNLDFFTVKLEDAFNIEAKLNRLIIAVDTNPNGEPYVLTFGNGIKRVGENGGLIDFIPNQNDLLSNPMDFAINSEGKFFVATNESGRRFIRVFSPSGVYLPNETLGDGSYGTTGANKFKGPVGLAFDSNDRLYVADHYIGDEDPPRPSSIKIYGKDNSSNYKNNLITEFDNIQGKLLNFPYRLAVNSKGHIYISELGQDGIAEVKIIQLDSNFIPTQIGTIGGPLDQIGAPGSIFIDKFDNVFIADFGNEIDLPRLLRSTENPEEFYDVFEIIKKGIQNDVFNINVYNPNNSFRSKISTGIDFPVDLAISKCGTLYVNNAIFDGTIRTFFGQRIPDISVDFDLEAYKRSPGYDTEAPSLITCPEDQPGTLINGNFVLPDYRNLTEFKDNCDEDLEITQTPPKGSGISETTEISIIAKDKDGNESDVCTFLVIIEVEEPEPSFDCNAPSNLELETDENCTAIPPDYSEYLINRENFADGFYTEQSYVQNSGSLRITIKVYHGQDQNGEYIDDCQFDVKLVDASDPLITSCNNSEIEVILEEGGIFTLPDYTSRLVATDNCNPSVEYIQDPAEGESITETTTINLQAIDEVGNTSAICSFKVVIISKEEDLPVFDYCPTEIVQNNEPGKCGAIVIFDEPIASNSQGSVEVTQISGPTSGSFFQVGASTLVFETKGSDGTVVKCQFNVVVKDNEKPQFTNQCEGVDYTANFEAGESFTMPNFYDQFPATDNCTTEVNFVQDPPPGTTISQEGIYPVTLTIRDDFGNSNTCSFNVILTTSDDLSFSCNSQYILQPDENCEYVLPDLSEEYLVSPSEAVVTQSVQQGQILNQDTEVVLTATYEEQTLTCKIRVILVDYVYPVISCLPTQYVTNTPSEGFVLPDYIQQIQYSDNCEIASVVQEPIPGTLINNNQIVRITATDDYGNSVHCIFDVYLSEEEDPLEISCPADQLISLDSDCSGVIPDFTEQAEVNDPNAIITQFPSEGTLIEIKTEITLTATLGDKITTCTFNLTPEDVIAPTVVCPPDQWENYDPANDFALPDYRGLAVASDACGIAQIQQSPSPGTYITQNTTVSLAVTDLSGNSITCAFMVNLTEDDVLQISCPEDQIVQPSENCSFALPDYTDLAEVNFNGVQVTQAPAPGSQISGNTTVILTASFNGQTDSCAFDVYSEDNTAPVANCIATGGYRLDQNGNVALTPEQINNGSTDNCGIVSMELNRTNFTTADIGDHTIRLTVKDAAGNTDSCETTISIWPYVGTGNEFTCKTSFILELDETGNATLSPEDLYTGDPQDRQLSLNKTEFSCENIGENNVTLSYTGTAGTGSCDVIVQVQDSRAPTIIARNITVTLDSQNQAIITPQMLDNGTSDNCSFTLSLDQTVFGCKDLGEKTITLTGTDSSGNSASATAVVTVIGVCDDPPIPVEGVDHIFIYPNPTPGPFKFATPTGMTIDRVEAFDARGRFIVAKTFDENLREYQMDLTGVEQAVYFLKIFSSDGAKILRVIIK